MGRLGEQPPSQVLPPDRRGTAAVSRANIGVAALRCRRERGGHEHCGPQLGEVTMSDEFERGRGIPFVPPKPQAEVDDELGFHLERRIQDNINRGMSPEAARRAALERFGDVAGVRQECAEMLTADRKAEARRDWLDDLRQDLRFAVRAAFRTPLFSLLAIVTLALGIGANAAVFGVVKSVLLDSLPYSDPGRLVRIYSPFNDGTIEKGSLSAGTVSDIRERQRSFSSFGAFLGPRDVVYLADDAPQVVKAVWAEPSLFRTLGVSPMRGAGFRDEDGLRDTAMVVMLPHATWQRMFGGDESVIGRSIRINGLPRTIVGVLPRSFVPLDGEADFYFPLGIPPFMRDPISVRGSHNFGFVGRLKPAVTPEAAHRELVGIGKELERLYAKDNLGIGLSGVPLRDAMVGDTRTPLLVLLASAALVLLITCANLAGALLSRSLSRRKEFAVRIALGAGRGRLVRQLLTESMMLALAGGATGLALAASSLHALRSLVLPALPPYADLTMDPGVVLVTILVALGTGVAFGVAPALSVGRTDTQGTLRDETRGTSESRPTRRLRGMLVAGQIALCISLLAGAGLLIRSLWAMTTAPVGFDPAGILTFAVQLPIDSHQPTAARAEFFDRFEERLRALPGVTGVASVSELPAPGMNRNGLAIQGVTWPQGEGQPFIAYASVSDDYFRTMRIPL